MRDGEMTDDPIAVNEQSEVPRERKDFEAIVSKYEGALLRYVSHIVRDPDAAQDIVQDTFIRLFSNWKEEWAPCTKLANWLYCVAHNIAIDYLRSRRRRALLHMVQAKEQPHSAPPDVGQPAQVSQQALEAADALGTLNMREQQLVILKVYEEKSYKEISEITGLTVSNVGYILHNALKKLAQQLQNKTST